MLMTPLRSHVESISTFSRHRRSLVVTALLFSLMGFYLIRSGSELRDTAGSAMSADLRWVLISILFQVLALSLIAANYRRILIRLGHQLEWQCMAKAHLRRHAIATLVPFGSPALYVMFARDLAPRGVSGNDAVAAVVLYSAGGQAAFVLFLTVAAGWLAMTSNLSVSMLAVFFALPVAIAWVALPFIALRFGVEKFARFRFIPARVTRLGERLGEHDLGPRDIFIPMLYSIAVNVTGLGMLVASLHAVGQRPSLTSLLVIRIVALVAAHAIPVMQGAGMVEFSMVNGLQQMGVHASTAAAATVLFRAAQFWLPLLLGMVLFANLPKLCELFRLRAVPIIQEVRLWWSASLSRIS